jgi:MFS family permease
MAMQVPGGRAADRWGARRSTALGLVLLVVGNAVALPAPTPALGFLGRAIVGIGTGLSFIGGSDYIRAHGGSPTLQGAYGGASVLAPGVALAIIPSLAQWTGFRAPYYSTIVVVLLCGVLLALAPEAPATSRHAPGLPLAGGLPAGGGGGGPAPPPPPPPPPAAPRGAGPAPAPPASSHRSGWTGASSATRASTAWPRSMRSRSASA